MTSVKPTGENHDDTTIPHSEETQHTRTRGETRNVSEACRRLGVSRKHFYDIKSEVQENGIEGLLEKSRRRPRIGNRVDESIEKKILDYALEFPTHGKPEKSSRERWVAHLVTLACVPQRVNNRGANGHIKPKME